MSRVSAIVLVFSLSCAQARSPVPSNAQLRAVWLSPELKLARNNAALTTAFEYAIPVVLADKPDEQQKKMASCADYFRLRRDGYEAVTDQDDDLMRLAGVRCHALKLAASMRPGNGDPARDLLTNKDPLIALPPTVGPAASPSKLKDRQDAANAGRSWRAYATSATSLVRDKTLFVNEPGLVSQLTPLASGDLDGDGNQELLCERWATGRRAIGAIFVYSFWLPPPRRVDIGLRVS